jgi:hypothetical protein
MTSRAGFVIGIALAVAVLGLGAALHLRPLILWALEIAPALRGEPHADRLRVATVNSFPPPRDEWVLLDAGALSVTAPIATHQFDACGRCADHCLLKLEGGGTLAILPDWPPGRYADALDAFGPDERDLSPLRSARANWSTIETLAARVRNPSALPEVVRFDTGATRGIVTVHRVPLGQSHVVYAYTHAGVALRVIGVTGIDPTEARRVIGSIRAKPRPPGPSETGRFGRCTPKQDGASLRLGVAGRD